jgi:hypothetical protein
MENTINKIEQLYPIDSGFIRTNEVGGILLL